MPDPLASTAEVREKLMKQKETTQVRVIYVLQVWLDTYRSDCAKCNRCPPNTILVSDDPEMRDLLQIFAHNIIVNPNVAKNILKMLTREVLRIEFIYFANFPSPYLHLVPLPQNRRLHQWFLRLLLILNFLTFIQSNWLAKSLSWTLHCSGKYLQKSF